jgi:hypothetical protein
MLIAHFTTKNMTPSTYAEVLRRLDAAGMGHPSGRLHHASYGSPDALRVTDIYDTKESLDAFGAVLMPILGALGIELLPPDVVPVHNIIQPRR